MSNQDQKAIFISSQLGGHEVPLCLPSVETAPSSFARSAVVLWRFRARAAHGDAERRAARVAGALLLTLAAISQSFRSRLCWAVAIPKPTLLGIAILVVAAVVMPWLAKEKRRMSGVTGSRALRADAAQSALCAYLSLIALAEMAVNLIWRKVGRPACGFSHCPSHRLGGSRSHAREGLRLLLVCPTRCVIISLAQSITKTCDFNHTRGFGGSL